MLHIALWEPEIPPNTGNIARLCAATGTRLHLIGKLGFRIDDAAVRRAGLDYWPSVDLAVHDTFETFLEQLPKPYRLWLIDNPAPRSYTQVAFQDGDCLLFGKESTGIPVELRERYADHLIDLPIPTGKVRSLNLSTAVGIVRYEALRQMQN